MTEEEFDVLDELYFVQDFSYLDGTIDISKAALIETLISLHRKGWIKVLNERDKEEIREKVDIPERFDQYYYLATKAGLLKHNTTD